MENESSPDFSPESTLLQIQRRPHSTPFDSGTSSSDDGVEGTLFQTATRPLEEYHESNPASESVDELCGMLAGFNLATQSLKNDHCQEVDLKKMGVQTSEVRAVRGVIGVDACTKSCGSDAKVATEGKTVIVDIERNFANEAHQRSETAHETIHTECQEFDRESAETEEVEAFGGCFPHKTKHVSWMSPEVSIRFSPSPTNTSPQTDTALDMDEDLIKTKTDLEQYQLHPKQFFLQQLHRFMMSHPINNSPQHYQTANVFVVRMTEKYRDKDDIRYRCFSHLLHSNIASYSAALCFLSFTEHSSQFSLLENSFIRGGELDKAAEACPVCSSGH